MAAFDLRSVEQWLYGNPHTNVLSHFIGTEDILKSFHSLGIPCGFLPAQLSGTTPQLGNKRQNSGISLTSNHVFNVMLYWD